MSKIDFCPILKEKCRDDCMWLDIQCVLDDDGVEQEKFCAITVIAAKLCIADGDEFY